MSWIQLIIFLLLISGFFTLLGIRFTNLFQNIAIGKKSTLKEDMDILLGKPAKGFFNRESMELEQLLSSTGRAERFNLVKRSSLILFSLGALLSIFLNNYFLVPVLGIGFAFAPIWYLRSTAMVYKKHLNEELETAISIITTSYLRSGDLLKAVQENIPYLNTPVKNAFEAFITDSEMINTNMISNINTLKLKISNPIFHEWCNTLIQCLSDRSMKNTLTFTVQKFSDMRIVQSELEAIINEPKKEAFAMMFLVLCNIPLLYVLNKNWFETLLFTTPGKFAMAISAGIILFSFTKIMQLSKPIEYTG